MASPANIPTITLRQDAMSSQTEELQIVVDTREGRPYSFPGATAKALPAGDYSILGYEHRIAVERKSLDDWLGTVLRSRDRFAREIEKLRHYDFAAIIVEATPQDILAGRYTSKISPASAFGITSELMVRFRPVHVILAGDRPHARLLTEKLLHFAARRCAEIDRREPESTTEGGEGTNDHDQGNCQKDKTCQTQAA